MKKRLGVIPGIVHTKKQQIKWFGEITRQKELNIQQNTTNKGYEKTSRGRSRKRWI